MANSKLQQLAQVHSLNGELIDHSLLKLVLMILARLQVDKPCQEKTF